MVEHLVSLSMIFLTSGVFTTDEPLTTDIRPETIETWESVHARFGWYSNGNSFPFDKKPKDPLTLPFFSLESENLTPTIIAKLPVPSVPFALSVRVEAPLITTGLNPSISAVQDACLVEVGRFSTLQFLNIQNTHVTDRGLKGISCLKNIRELSLQDCIGVSDIGIRHLTGFKNLRSLRLDRTRITDAGLKDIAGFQQLQTLEPVIDLSS